MIEEALKLARIGFYVFPLLPNSKFPAVNDYTAVSTRDESKIRKMWTDPVMGNSQPFNIGIAMRGLFVGIDVDTKDGKQGLDSLLELELEGKILTPTFTQTTPTGGIHYVYRVSKDSSRIFRNSVSSLASGIDLRGLGGYLVAAGSLIDGKAYVVQNEIAPQDAPAWLYEETFALPRLRGTEQESSGLKDADPTIAERRARSVASRCTGAQKGSRDQMAYRLACEFSNIGLTEDKAFEVLSEVWAPKCEPPFPDEDLRTSVMNAFRYCREKGAVNAPENEFTDIDDEPAAVETEPTMIEKLNQKYGFVMVGSSHYILEEKRTPRGVQGIELYKEHSFHAKLADLTFRDAKGKLKQWSQEWMFSKARRNYEGLCFFPRSDVNLHGHYNLFQGFEVERPTHAPVESKTVSAFIEHIHENVAMGNDTHARWIINFFAHLIQRPWEKPIVALVLRGGKGVGKNALVDVVGNLLGRQHYVTCWSKSQALSHFNVHLEKCLLLNLNEAFWSGDKSVEGVLKGLITERTMRIERKGIDSYEIDNYMRVVIMGNESWLVPATSDERRFAVFDLGTGKQRNREFFEPLKNPSLRDQQELLRYLLNYEIDEIALTEAPETTALVSQKLESAGPLVRWWRECLINERIINLDLCDQWPPVFEKTTDIFEAYEKYHQRYSRYPVCSNKVMRDLRQICPSLKRIREPTGNDRHWGYVFPSLEQARIEFENYMKGKIEWNE